MGNDTSYVLRVPGLSGQAGSSAKVANLREPSNSFLSSVHHCQIQSKPELAFQ